MKYLISFLALVLFSILLGLFFVRDPGYALLAYNGVSIEMPLWIFIVTILFLLVVIIYTNQIFVKIKLWLVNRTVTKNASCLEKGLLALEAEQWQEAENFLKCYPKLASYASFKLALYLQSINYLSKYSNFKLAKINTNDQTSELSILENILNQIQKKEGSTRLNLKFMAELYELTNQWHKLMNFIPLLKTKKVYGDYRYKSLEAKIYYHTIQNHFANKDDLILIWDKLPAYFKVNAEYQRYLVAMLMKELKWTEAVKFIKDCLNSSWDENLCLLYGDIALLDISAQIGQVEKWIVNRKDDWALYLTAGKLCQAANLWGKAKNYFKLSLNLKPSLEAYMGVGTLFDIMQSKGKEEN